MAQPKPSVRFGPIRDWPSGAAESFQPLRPADRNGASRRVRLNPSCNFGPIKRWKQANLNPILPLNCGSSAVKSRTNRANQSIF